jgi:hypothetical protein
MIVKLHSQTYEWRERSEDGRVRIIRAGWDTRGWNFEETYKDLPDWHPLPNPSLEDYEALRDFLWRKYQRKRLPWRFIEQVDGQIAEMRKNA